MWISPQGEIHQIIFDSVEDIESFVDNLRKRRLTREEAREMGMDDLAYDIRTAELDYFEQRKKEGKWPDWGNENGQKDLKKVELETKVKVASPAAGLAFGLAAGGTLIEATREVFDHKAALAVAAVVAVRLSVMAVKARKECDALCEAKGYPRVLGPKFSKVAKAFVLGAICAVAADMVWHDRDATSSRSIPAQHPSAP